MDTADFLTLWANMELRQFVIDEAKRRGKTVFIRQDMVSDMWLAIGDSPEGLQFECYKAIARNCIDCGGGAKWIRRKEKKTY